MKDSTKFPLNLQFFAASSDGVQGTEPTTTVDASTDGGTQQTQSQPLDVAGMQQLINSFNQQQTNVQQAQPTQVEQNQQAQEQQTAQNPNSEEQNQQQQVTQQQKDSQAFATMRVQNKQLSDMLGKIAKANGIEFSDSNELIEKLNDDALGKLAQQQGVPKELLQRMEMLEAQNTQFLQAQRQENLTQQFTALATKYQLDENQLTDFANQLAQKGINPLEQNVNLDDMYRSINFDALMQAQVQAAVAAALARDQAASTNGTQPNAVQGSPASGAAQQYNINTTAGLEQLLAQMPK